MENPVHLTDEQWNGYRSRTLSPSELLEIDEHISVCEACRGLAVHPPDLAQIRSLRAELSVHLEYAEVVACAEGNPSPESTQHLLECDLCAAEVDDLRQFRAELRTSTRPSTVTIRRWMPAAIAAGVVFAAGLSFWYARPGKPVPAEVVERPTSPNQRQALNLAAAAHRLERAPILDHLIRKRGELLGVSTGPAFELTAPMGTAILTDRPRFEWKPLTRPARYVVAVFDENFNKVVESPEVAATAWQPESPLPRGQVFVWQVTARVGAGTVHAPVPPEPEARFEVVSVQEAREIESARRDHPGDHALMAELLAKDGALDEAGKEIDALASTDPAGAAALRASLAQIRGH